MKKIRLQVALAKAGAASRRKAALLIKEGRVSVNGRKITEPGFRVDMREDTIRLGSRRVYAEKKYYYMLHKPTGVISTASDERNRKTVLDYVPKKARVYPVGRLDKDTTGLLLLTNDGALAYKLTHPRFEIPKVYEIKTKKKPDAALLKKLETGVMVDGKAARAKKIVTRGKKGPHFSLCLTISEGRKREVRHMFENIGYDNILLKRVSFGPLAIGNLQEGKIRELTEKELSELRKI